MYMVIQVWLEELFGGPNWVQKGHRINEPWLCVRDFNDILGTSKNGRPAWKFGKNVAIQEHDQQL